MPASLILSKAQALGLNRDFLKAGKKQLGVVAVCRRDLQNGQALRWRWSLPAHTPTPTPVPSLLPQRIPHRWGVYAYNQDGGYYYRREQADTFRKLKTATDQGELELPLWVVLTSAPTDAELMLPIRLP